MIVPFGASDFLVGLAVDPFRKESCVFGFVRWQFIHFFADYSGKNVLGNFFGDNLVHSNSFGCSIFGVGLELFLSTAVILLAHVFFPFKY